MKFSDASNDYLLYIKIERGLAKTTFHTYQSWLHNYQRWLGENGHEDDVAAFTTLVLRRYLYDLAKKNYRPRTVRGVFHPLRGLGVFLVESGFLTENPVNGLKMPKKDAPIRLLVSKEEVVAILEAPNRLHNQRQAALYRACLSVLVYCGVRSGELLDLKVQDLIEDRLIVASGKGSKRRELFPPKECRDALAEWLSLREKDCCHDSLWALDRGRGMGRFSLRQMLDELKAIAGLSQNHNIQPHSLRHFFATHMMNKGASIKTVQFALGHSLPTTTYRYLHLDSEQARSMSEYASLDLGSPNSKQGAPKPQARDEKNARPARVQSNSGESRRTRYPRLR